MKNKKSASWQTQFPNIYRFITENKTVRYLSKVEFRLLNQSKYKKEIIYFLSFIIVFVTILLFVATSALAVKLYQEVSLYSKITNQRQIMQEKINFWQSFTQNYDGYKDAYFQIALLEYSLGNFEKAREYNKQVLLLDPGFEDAKNLEVLFENK